MSVSILRIKDKNGNWVQIPAIKGDKGADGTVSFNDLSEEQKESLKGKDGKDGFGEIVQTTGTRKDAVMSQNVVTYVVEVSADNSDGKLLPYLTANVKFIRSSRKGVPAVSNAALRFIPDAELVAPSDRAVLEKVSSGQMRRSREKIVWSVGADKKLRAVKIKTGLNDGIMTEIVGGDLKAGDEVVNGVTVISGDAPARQPAGGSPFMPKPPQRKRR
jgi:HlyD family secretion protein